MELYSWDSFWLWIYWFVDASNTSYAHCVTIITTNPFDYLDTIANTVCSIIQGTAISLITLFFLIDFFKKSFDLQWIKWENVLMLMMKLIFAKVIVDNAQNIMHFVFDVFTTLTQTAANSLNTGSSGFLPGITTAYPNTPQSEISNMLSSFLTTAEIDHYMNNAGFLGIERWLKQAELIIPLTLMWLIMLVAEVIVFARIFEIVIYTMISPIPLASFANDEHRQIGISFIKSYAAVCLQGLILIVVFVAYNQLANMTNIFQNIGMASGSSGVLFRTAALGIAVFKSGSWAKKMCGAM